MPRSATALALTAAAALLWGTPAVVAAEGASIDDAPAMARRAGPAFLQTLLAGRPPTPADTPVQFGIGLRPRNLLRLEAEWRARSTPGSPLFHAWLSTAEVRALVANPAAMARTLEFLGRHGVIGSDDGTAVAEEGYGGEGGTVRVSSDRLWLSVHTTAARVADMFAADLREIAPGVHRAAHYTVPPELQRAGAVDLVVGLADVPPDTQSFRDGVAAFGQQQQQYTGTPPPVALSFAGAAVGSAEVKSAAAVVKSPSPSLPPLAPSPATAWEECCVLPCRCLNTSAVDALYGADAGTTIAHPAIATAGVFEVETYESYLPSDTATFQQLNGQANHPVAQFAGENITIGCANYLCAEPDLDVQMLLGAAPGLNLTYYVTSMTQGNPVLAYLQLVSAQSAPPLVHSISWGPPEAHLTAEEAARMEAEFLMLSTRGLTFVTSSGDDGVNSRAARGDPAECGLSPQYPAGVPYVTTVGGTFGPDYGLSSEVACATDVAEMPATTTSGGGFSQWFDQPAYQAEAVQSYLKGQGAAWLPPAAAFNASKRAYPDVALLANNIHSVLAGMQIPGSGTSASAPLFSAYVVRLLDAKLAASAAHGGSNSSSVGLGSLNPALYAIARSTPDAFHDVTSGWNHCTGIYGSQRNFTCCPQGFNASTGWDAVTGLGSINFPVLRDAYLNLSATSA